MDKSSNVGGTVYLTIVDSTSKTLGLLAELPSGSTSYAFTGLVWPYTCSSCTLGAVSASFTTVSSNTFDIVVGAATSLRFTQMPTTGTTSTLCSGTSVQVSAYDPTGQYVDTTFTGAVTLQLAQGSGTMTALSVNAASGVATFNSCTILGTGTFQFFATATGLTSATSATFAVTLDSLKYLTFTTSSVSGSVGTSITLTASCYDTSNVLLTTCTQSVNVSKSAGPGSISAGAGPYTPTAGVYTFSVTVDTGGSYTLTLACNGGCAGVTLGTMTLVAASTGSVILDFNSPIQKSHTGQTYQLKLSPASTSSVSIVISSNDSTKLQVYTGVTIPAGDTSWHTVTVSAPDYPAPAATSIYTVTISHTLTSSDPNYSGVATFPGCIVTSTAGNGLATLPIYNFVDYTVNIDSSVVVVEGSSSTYQVSLGSQPSTNVVVTPTFTALAPCTALPPAYVTFSSALTFTNANWATTQSITVTVGTTSVSAVPATYCILHTLSGDATYVSSAVVIPTNKITTVTVVVTTAAGIGFSGNVAIQSGGSGTYKVNLLSQPANTVTLTLTSSVASVTVSPTSLTFTTGNYATLQTVTVSFTMTVTFNYESFSAVITHTAASTDGLYSGMTGTYTVEIVNICTPGVYTWPGGATCSNCVTGFDCTGASPVSCVVGKYNAVITNVACLTCAANSYCPSATTTGSACPTGYTSGAQAIECTRCSTSKYVTGGNCNGCAANNYSTGAATSCSSCAAGLACPSSHRAVQIPCNYGTYAVAASTSCTSCVTGKYSTITTTAAAASCGAGTFSLGGVRGCTTCASQTSCSTTAGLATFCAEGTIRNQGIAVTPCSAPGVNIYVSILYPGVQATCPAGYIVSSAKACISCTTGNYCVNSVSASCPIGTYSMGGAAICKPCPVGYYASSAGSSSCTMCPAGSSCLDPTAAPVACGAGTYSYAGSIVCYPCLAGSACAASSATPMSALCSAGFYCGISLSGVVIQVVRIPCPGGQYGSGATILGSQAHGCFDCPAGSFCNSGATSPTACPSGYYCPPRTASATQFPCPPGMSNAGSAESVADCSDCTATFVCSGATTSPGTVCGVGNFCPAGTQSANDHPCPMGTYTGPAPAGSGASASTICSSCIHGGYCPAASSIPLLCPQGTYNAATGSGYLQNCIPCDPAKVCPVGALFAIPVATCTAGYYCPQGSFAPIPCPAGTFSSATTNLSVDDCTPCTATFACAIGSTAASTACTAGYYCPEGTAYPTQYPCPAGTYSAASGASLADCLPCTQSNACITASSAPVTCTAGYYCPASTDYPVQYPCPAGSYSASTTLYQASDCTVCPSGNYCPLASTAPIPCPAGSFASAPSGALGAMYMGPGITNSCQICTAGNYCAIGTTTPAPCAAGTYSTAGLSVCLTCVAGYICAGGTSDTVMYSTPCTAGYICPAGTSVLGTAPSTICIVGNYCPQGTQAAIPCPPGTFMDVTGAGAKANTNVCVNSCTLTGCSSTACVTSGCLSNGCITTPAGFYTNNLGSTTCAANLCTAGYYCPAGSTYATVISCPAGTFRATSGGGAAADCAQCTAGAYCRFEATVTPTPCPAGYYCLAGSVTPTPCPQGTFNAGPSAVDLTGCLACTAGNYCDEAGAIAVKGPCKAGFWCISGATTSTPTDGTTGKLCPAGGYCPAGTATVQACASGYYNDLKGSKSSSDCKLCVQGYYCAGTTLSTPSGQCDAGYWCVAGSATAQQNTAQPGYYAPQGSIAQVPCLPGYFTGSVAQGSCVQCTIGHYCENSATSIPVICPSGYYCPIGSIVKTPCPPGTFFSGTGATDVTECTACTGGNYCKTPGLSNPTGQCSAGYFCTQNAVYMQPVTLLAGSYGPCPAGYYCVLGTTTPAPCAAGTYNPAQGGAASTDCIPCAAGYFCPNANMSVIDPVAQLCPEGYYCTQGQSSDTTNQCPVGYSCPAGSPTKIKCEAGTYQDAVGQGTCTQCLAGYFCPTGTGDYTLNPCPAGYYCPAGTEYGTEYPCPQGTYNSATGKQVVGDCTTCTAGSYCNTMGLPNPVAQCDQGFYCSSGSTTARPNVGAAYGGRCTIGYICPAGASSRTPCPAGSYCAADELGAVSGTCYAGYVCNSAAVVPAPIDGVTGWICPAGYYCTAGTSAAVACAAGTFLPYKGGSSVTECLPCIPGFVCPTAGLPTPVVQCPLGYYCALGVSVASVKCPAGSMCPLQSAYPIKCPKGSYQDQVGQGSCITCNTPGTYCLEGATIPVSCEMGYYCPLDLSGYTSHQPCPVGTYNPSTSGVDSLACLTCTPGSYCATIALPAVSGSCQGGYYCSGGAVSATPLDASQGGICPKGTFCPIGSSTATPCTAGYYCQKAGLSAVSGQCVAGYYCTLGSWMPNPTDGTRGNICAVGRYCPVGSSTSTPCPVGTYSNANGLAASGDCLQCPYGNYCSTTGLTQPTGLCDAGYYCGSGSTSAQSTICPVGYYCPIGSFEAIPCPMGTYQSSTGQSSCATCPLGSYCTGGANSPQPCPIGYYCPGSTRFNKEFPCPDGTFASATGQSVCTPCTAGFTCNTAASVASTTCPLNMFCPTGSGYGTICLPGTYNTATPGLIQASDCLSCPVGSYCVDGTVSDLCEAGYYCTGGSYTPTPPSSSSSTNAPCAPGYYCTKGAVTQTQCPAGKVNPLPKGAQVSACTTCPPGSYCVVGNPQPIPCPAGMFCPQGVQVGTKCRVHTYNPITSAVSESSCIVCPAGYICTDEGAVTYALSKYECPVGHYCVEGGFQAISCPPGTFTNSTKVGSAAECTPCSGGQQCPGDGLPIQWGCPEGTYCPLGSSMPQPCPVGYYCPTNSTNPIICPATYFCPKYALPNIFNYTLANLTTDICVTSINPLVNHTNTSSPFTCPTNSICPKGSFEPQYCAPGQYVGNNTCVYCQPGTYSKVAGASCQICYGGYICMTGATRPDPTNIAVYGGYQCPVGYYCPAGALNPIPCAIATYNPDIGAAANSSCLLCPTNSYNDKQGQDRCTPCGSSSVSVPGSVICACIGLNRAFQKSDGSCRCVPGYEFSQEGFTLSTDDSTTDCYPKVFVLCAPGEIRGPNGDCKIHSDCANECGSAGGSVLEGVGVCQCNNVKNLDDICNNECRTTAPVVTIDSSGQYMILNTTTQRSMSINLLNQTGYLASVIPGSSGRVYSVDMLTTGPSAKYSMGKALSGFNTTNITIGRRLQNEDPAGIVNPVACLNMGDTFLFSINSSTHFPVYNKDSLINTNPEFDYGAFLELERMITSGSTQVTVFAFTFNESGIYDFEDSSNPDSHIIVSVIGRGQNCPDSNLPLKTRTQASVLTLGTSTTSNIIKDPNWALIGGLMGGIFVIFAMLIGGLNFFFSKEWKHTEAVAPMYRTQQQSSDLTSLRLKHHQAKDGEDPELSKSEKEYQDVKAYDDIDPSIFQSMHDRMIDYHHKLAEGFEAQTQEARTALAKIVSQLEKLRELLEARLAGLDPLLLEEKEEEKPEKKEESRFESKAIQDQPSSPSAFYDVMINKYIAANEEKREERTDELRDRVMNDPNLSEEDKEALLGDLQTELDRIRMQAEQDRSLHDDRLQQRLLERERNRARARGGESLAIESAAAATSSAGSSAFTSPRFTEEEIQTELRKIEVERVAEMDQSVSDLQRKHQEKLAQVSSPDEADALMREYERDMKRIEDTAAEHAALKKRQLEERLAGKKKRKAPSIHIPSSTVVPAMPEFVMPEVVLEADLAKMDELATQHEEAKRRLQVKHEQEMQLLNTESDNLDPVAIRARLDQGVDNEDEKRRLMAQLQAAIDAQKENEEGQQRKLEDRLRSRQQRKSLRKLALKDQQQAEMTDLTGKQEEEEDRLKSDLELEQLLALVRSKDGSPEELAALVRKLLDDKHDQELANLAARKHAAVVERQMQTLQRQVELKAERVAAIRLEAQRSGASPKEEKDAILQTESDYITDLRREMDSALGRLEDEYRRKLLDLTDKQMKEMEEVLRCIRALDPAALERHLANAKQEGDVLKAEAEQLYESKKSQLEQDLNNLEEELKEEENKTMELDREVDERKKRLEDVALQRQKLEQRQKELLEKLKQQGISQEAEEDMLRKHQQELEQWDNAIEAEMARQRAILEKKRAARQEKQQSRKVAAYKEERQQHLQEEVAQRLVIQRRAGVSERLIEPFHDLESKLRVDPLPRQSSYTVEMEATENVLDSLLQKVKRVEQVVETVDAQQFTNAIDALQNLYKLIASSSSHSKR